MTIKQLSYKSGVIYDMQKHVLDTAENFLERDQDAVKALAAKEYSITPVLWNHHRFDYNLIVHPGGEGALRMLPTNESSRIIKLENEKITSEPGGGRIIRIPADQSMVVLTGTLPGDPRRRIFEILTHVSGRSPER